MYNTLIITTLITAGVSLVISVLGFVRQWRKDNTDAELTDSTAASTVTAAALALIEPMNVRIEQLELVCVKYKADAAHMQANIANLMAEVKHYKAILSRRDKRIEFLLGGIRILTEQLVANDVQPAFVFNIKKDGGDGKAKTEGGKAA